LNAPENKYCFVLDGDPVCNTTHDNKNSSNNSNDKDVVFDSSIHTSQHSCSVKYSGDWAPTMQWSTEVDDVMSPVNSTFITNSTANDTVTYTVNGFESVNGLTCMTYFHASTRSSVSKYSNLHVASNTPAYSYNWTSAKYLSKPSIIAVPFPTKTSE